MSNRQKVDNYSSREGKETWVKSLKKGDFVEDCRYRIIQIKEVRHDFTGTREGWPKMVLKILLWLPLPTNLWYWLNARLSDLLPKGGYVETTLVLEDGANCSAISCCDSLEVAKQNIPHEEPVQ